MPNTKIKIITTVLILLLSFSAFSIDKEKLIYKNAIYSNDVKTMRMHLTGWEVSYPILDMFGDNTLRFSFDRLDAQRETYYYTIIHCNTDWKASNLMFFEYAEGFEENEVRNYESSINTFVNYTHYFVELPNEDVHFTKSGNYFIVVYTKEGSKKTIICTHKFMLFEQLLDIDARINASPDNLHRRTSQKVDFRISRNNFYFDDPFRELKIVIMQNFQEHNLITGLKPSFISNHELVYEYDDENLFKASNEYRSFAFHNTEILSEFVDYIDFRHPFFYVKLLPQESKLFRRYSSIEDINGHFVLHTRRFRAGDYPEIETDYAIVDFILNYDVPVNNASVYIFGELSNREFSEMFKMSYDLEQRAYRKQLLLKQGYYNYRYVLVYDDESKAKDHCFFEGSHFETENDYLILVYHREPGRTYDKLISYTKLNSRK